MVSGAACYHFCAPVQELGLADYAAERAPTPRADAANAADGAAWRGHFQQFYKPIYAHLSTLVEVSRHCPVQVLRCFLCINTHSIMISTIE